MKPPSLQILSPSVLETALAQIGEGLLLLDSSWEICYLNELAAAYLDQPSPALVRQKLWATLPRLEAEKSEFYAACQRSVTEQLPLSFESEDLCPRESLWVRLVPTDNGLMVYLRGMAGDHRASHQQRHYANREALLTDIAEHIQRSAPLCQTFQATVQRLLPLFRVDRALLYRIENWTSVELFAQATTPDWPLSPADEQRITWVMNSLQDWEEGSYYPVADVDQDDVTAAEQRLLHQLQVKSQLVMPIFTDDALWGLLVLHQCSTPRHWRSANIALLQKVVQHMTIALKHNELRQQVGLLNADLDAQVLERTTQLQKALDWEAMLKRITDKVRDSLDENQILQKAVQELALVMGMGACNAALYDLERQTSTIYYEYVTTLPTSQGRVAKMTNYPEIYNQLLQAQQFQFCSITPNPVRGRVAMLACPIFDNEGVLGDLWLVNHEDYAFSEREIRLVQQAANQCAIALRQARLYQAAQAQVAELEKINRLKDEFLSTVSHELRTPMTNMKMGILMLDVALNRRQDQIQTSQPQIQLFDSKVTHYIEILRKECERESQLINDLLDLQRLDADSQPLDLKAIILKDWLPSLINIFNERANERQQRLRLDVPEGLPSLVTNIPGLERIVAELLNNACKYTPAGCEICIQATHLGNVMELAVINSGVEIPPLEVARVFDKFYRVPSNDPWKQGGTGLGLALVKKLSQHLGGDIRAESGEGRTRFIVQLPLNLEKRQSQRLGPGQ